MTPLLYQLSYSATGVIRKAGGDRARPLRLSSEARGASAAAATDELQHVLVVGLRKLPEEGVAARRGRPLGAGNGGMQGLRQLNRDQDVLRARQNHRRYLDLAEARGRVVHLDRVELRQVAF